MSIADYPDWSTPGASSTGALSVTEAIGFKGLGPSGATELIELLDVTFPGRPLPLFGLDLALDVGGTSGLYNVYDDNNGYQVACGYLAAGSAEHIQCNGVLILGNLKMQCFDADIIYSLRWGVFGD
jgi:hypothetical protein